MHPLAPATLQNATKTFVKADIFEQEPPKSHSPNLTKSSDKISVITRSPTRQMDGSGETAMLSDRPRDRDRNPPLLRLHFFGPVALREWNALKPPLFSAAPLFCHSSSLSGAGEHQFRKSYCLRGQVQSKNILRLFSVQLPRTEKGEL